MKDVERGLTQSRLHEVLDYDPATGVFRWKVRTSIRNKVGAVAGISVNDSGYAIITIDYCKFRAHRLAWLYMHGVWPSYEVDHINGHRSDNRILNLRDVQQELNQQNRRSANSNSRTGVLGVSWHKQRGKYTARIKVGSRYRSLGLHETVEAASAAYLAAKRVLHEGCTI
jgi:hypothetical protein